MRGQLHATGIDRDGLHSALRDLALADREVARDAFGVVCNCLGAWEDEYTEEQALTFEDWMQRMELGGVTWVDDDDELQTGM